MKRTAFAVMSLVVLFSTVVVSQLCNSANANPNWRPWENKISPPLITVLSPVDNHPYISTEVVLSFTVTKPADWVASNGQIKLVSYFLDSQPVFIDPRSDEENIVQVHDSSDSENPILSFSFSFKLRGLKDGNHRVHIFADGYVNSTGVGTSAIMDFTTYTPGEESQIESLPTSLVLASAIPVAVVLVGLGLLVYRIKKK